MTLRPEQTLEDDQSTHIGYLFTGPQGDAWQGVVQVPGLSLSHRLPTWMVWLSFGLNGSGAAQWVGVAQEEFAQLEVALPSPPRTLLSKVGRMSRPGGAGCDRNGSPTSGRRRSR
jgi:hypothetical protein